MRFLSRAFPELTLLVLALTLAACQAPGSAPPAVNRAPPPAPAASNGRGEAAIPPPASRAELASNPLRFTGMSGGEVTGLLGKPSFQRHDADAEIWQYYGPASACVLDLFLYPDHGEARVAHAELRSRSTGSASACLAQILDGGRG